MCSKGLLKRILPFFATFAVAIFITSFFVDLSAPRFGRGHRMHHEMERMQMELQQQREENRRLREQLDGGKMNVVTMEAPEMDEIPLDVRVPLPPPHPIAPHARH